jgi:hypothetical protein
MSCCNSKIKNPLYPLVDILLLKRFRGKQTRVESLDQAVVDILGCENCKDPKCVCIRPFIIDRVTGAKYEIVIDSGVMSAEPVIPVEEGEGGLQ